MIQSTVIKFLGSDDKETAQCFTAGKRYHADVSSAGNLFVYDDHGATWVIDPDDGDFKVGE